MSTRAKWTWLAVGSMICVMAVAGVSYVRAKHDTSPRRNVADSQNTRKLAVAATCSTPVSAGNSCVMTDSPGSPVILRACDHLPDSGDPPSYCGVTDHLQDGTQVTMRCWVDSSPPPDDSHTSPRWFYVNEVNGPHPGYSGYIYSVLVLHQVSTPMCTQPIISHYQDPVYQPPRPLQFRVVGSCTSAGGTLTSASSNFTPGAQFEVSAIYPDGSPYPLAAIAGTVNTDGSVPWTWPCAGDPPGTYHTDLVDLSDGMDTGEVPFTIEPAQGTSLPASAPSAPQSAPGPSSPTAAAPLDADATPAFGTCPSNPPPSSEKYCGGWSSSCSSPSFSQSGCPNLVHQGALVHPVCWVTGQMIYNNYSADAPGASWTLKSDIWIKVADYPSDPWMNELWFDPDNTASDGLPAC